MQIGSHCQFCIDVQTMEVTSPVKVARSDKEAVVNRALSELKAAVCGQNCSIAVAKECMSLECKEPSCAAKFLAKGVAEVQKAGQSVEIVVHSLLICVNKQMQASEEQVVFLKKTVAGLRQRIEELDAAATGAAESGSYYQLCAVLHYG